MGLDFEAFLKDRAANFKEIARRTRGAMSVEDLHNEAWLAAVEIGRKRDRDIDWRNRTDQELIFACLHNMHVAWADWRFRTAFSLDVGPDDDDDYRPSLLERLSDNSVPDPLALLELRETEQVQKEAEEQALAASYSQAAAYFIVFDHFASSRKRICAHLLVHRSTLYQRVRRASESFHAQVSLFDRIARIEKSFMPLPGREYRHRTHLIGNDAQAEFVF
jgi:hypothetical protein